MPRYNDTILNYYNDNKHVGSFNIKNKNIGTGLVGSPSCGDVMKLQIKVKKDKKTKTEKIVDAKILVFGCGSAKASSSYVAQQLIGKTINEALKIKNTDIANSIGLPKIKLHCSVLAESAIKQAVDDYKNKSSKSKKDTKTQSKKTPTKKYKSIDEKIDVSISKEATDFVKKHLSKIKNNPIGIMLNLEEGHCGLMYKVRFVEKKDNIEDCICLEKNNLKIFIKNDEKEILNGTKIEYKEEGLKRGLIFENPKETGRCSCGLNFFTKEKKQKKNNCK